MSNVPKTFRFVNKMLNVAYVSGFVTKVDKENEAYFIGQTANREQDVRVSSHGKRLPKKGDIVTATCHIYGMKKERPRKQPPSDGAQGGTVEGLPEEPEHILFADARALSTQAASILSLPTADVYFGSSSKSQRNGKKPGVGTILHNNQKAVADENSPYNENGEMREEYKEKINENALKEGQGMDDMWETIKEIVESSLGKVNTAYGKNSNVVFITGMVQESSIVKPNKFRKKEYLLLLLRQEENTDKLIPVRFEPENEIPVSVFAKQTKPGMPVKIIGEIRVKPILDDDGDLLGNEQYIRCRQLVTPNIGKDILGFPVWWSEFARKISAERKENSVKLQETKNTLQNDHSIFDRLEDYDDE